MLLEEADKEIYDAILAENNRQQSVIELIASENIASEAVREAQGSIMTNKYAEGYPGRRYYGGCEYVDIAEQLAIDRLKLLFGCKYANVQPHSGSQANQAVYFALLNPGDTVLGMSLDCGGHLTHGSKVNQSGKWFNVVPYGVAPDTHMIDYDEVRDLALKHSPKMIIAGWSAYSRILDFGIFRSIADEVGAYLLVDMAHFAGLVAAGVHPSPIGIADVVTSTTHKTLRGPRGGVILSNDETMAKKINSAIFPGIQGGPMMHTIAAKAVAFLEASQPEYREYIAQVVANARAMAKYFMQQGMGVITGGTDTHVFLLDLVDLTGKEVESGLGGINIACNKNMLPFDTRSPFVTSGIRIGTPVITTRGFKEEDAMEIADIICNFIQGVRDDDIQTQRLLESVRILTDSFPILANDA